MCVYTCSKKRICYRQSLLQADPEEMYSKRKKKKKALMKLPDKHPFQIDSNIVACRKMRQLWKIVFNRKKI